MMMMRVERRDAPGSRFSLAKKKQNTESGGKNQGTGVFLSKAAASAVRVGAGR